MIPPASSESNTMSFGHGHSAPGQGLENYYDNIPHHWPGIQASPYVSTNHPYCTVGFPPSSILTPISLPDGTFVHARSSPVLSHHSQEHQQRPTDAAPIRELPLPQHGLGITVPFQGDYLRTTNAGLSYPSEDMQYVPHDAFPPQQPAAKRMRRSRRPSPPQREAPVSILPNPEGMHRLDQDQRRGHGKTYPHQRPRAPGRNRKDPRAEEEDIFVEQLREQNIAWKVVREMFRERFHKDATEPRLQMRQMRRRKERLARWDEIDIQFLMRARDYWEQEKYQIIAQKMKDLGSTKNYTAQHCEAQLNILEQQQRLEGEQQQQLQQLPQAEPGRPSSHSVSFPVQSAPIPSPGQRRRRPAQRYNPPRTTAP